MKNRWWTRIAGCLKCCCVYWGNDFQPPSPDLQGLSSLRWLQSPNFNSDSIASADIEVNAFHLGAQVTIVNIFGEAELQATVATAAFSFGSKALLPSEVQHTIWWIPHSVLQLQFIKRWIKTLAQQWPQEYFSSNIIPEGSGDTELCLIWDIILDTSLSWCSASQHSLLK